MLIAAKGPHLFSSLWQTSNKGARQRPFYKFVMSRPCPSSINSRVRLIGLPSVYPPIHLCISSPLLNYRQEVLQCPVALQLSTNGLRNCTSGRPYDTHLLTWLAYKKHKTSDCARKRTHTQHIYMYIFLPTQIHGISANISADSGRQISTMLKKIAYDDNC